MQWVIARNFFLVLFLIAAAIAPGWARYVVTESLRANVFVNGVEFFIAATAGPRDLFFVVALLSLTGLYLVSLESFLRKHSASARSVVSWRFVPATVLAISGYVAFLSAFLEAEASIASMPFWNEVREVLLGDDRFGFVGNVVYAVAVANLGWIFYVFRKWIHSHDPNQATATMAQRA